MTLEEFYTEFEKVADGFIINAFMGGIIRKGCNCPITAVAENITGDLYTVAETKSAGYAIGLCELDRMFIIFAADNARHNNDIIIIRQRLLEIVRKQGRVGHVE